MIIKFDGIILNKCSHGTKDTIIIYPGLQATVVMDEGDCKFEITSGKMYQSIVFISNEKAVKSFNLINLALQYSSNEINEKYPQYLI